MSISQFGPFFGPIRDRRERGAVLFKQGRDYKVEDGLPLIELARAIPADASDRVDFFPIEAQAKLMFKVGELLEDFRDQRSDKAEAPPKDAESIGTNFDAMVDHNKWWQFEHPHQQKAAKPIYKLFREFCIRKSTRKESAIERDLDVPAATNLLIIGRPQFFATWWLDWAQSRGLKNADGAPNPKDGSNNSDTPTDKRARDDWPTHWFRLLVLRAGYPARYALPFNPDGVFFAYGQQDALYDRKLGRVYKRPKSSAKETEIDFGLVFSNRVTIGGIERRVTICTGLGALGTWAATRFIADPQFWTRLRGIDQVSDAEGPLEVALRIRMDHHERAWPLGPYRLDFNHVVEILNNNDPSDYLGHTCNTENRPVYCHVNELVPNHRQLDLGRPINALRVLMEGDEGRLKKVDTAWNETFYGEPSDGSEFLKSVLLADYPNLRRDFEGLDGLRPKFEVPKADKIQGNCEIKLRNTNITWSPEGTLVVGPHLFITLLETIKFLWETASRADKGKPPAPLLLLGDSGAGKGQIVAAIEYLWRLVRRQPEMRHEKMIAAPDSTLTHRLERNLQPFVDNEGTLFIDEFSELKLPSQSTLLPLLQDGELPPPRGKPGEPRRHQALIICATSRLLDDESFPVLPDLRNRFHEVRIQALSDRLADAAVLFAHLWRRRRGNLRITVPALKLFLSDPFAGNARVLSRETVPHLSDLYVRSVPKEGAPVTSEMMRQILLPNSGPLAPLFGDGDRGTDGKNDKADEGAVQIEFDVSQADVSLEKIAIQLKPDPSKNRVAQSA